DEAAGAQKPSLFTREQRIHARPVRHRLGLVQEGLGSQEIPFFAPGFLALATGLELDRLTALLDEIDPATPGRRLPRCEGAVGLTHRKEPLPALQISGEGRATALAHPGHQFRERLPDRLLALAEGPR